MPKLEIDYSNTIIYKITCIEPTITDVYVGHTTNFVQRKHAHKRSCTNQKSANYKCKLYTVIRNNGGWINWKMEIVNFYNCHDHYEARKKEQEYFISLKATLNSIEPLPLPKPKPEPKPKLKSKEPEKPEELKMTKISCPEVATRFYCTKCCYATDKKSSYDKHNLALKHKNAKHTAQLTNKKCPKVAKIFVCDCGKEYIHQSSLWNHKQKCKINSVPDTSVVQQEVLKPQTDVPNNIITSELVMELLKQNNEFKSLIVELVSKGVGNNNTNINSNNTTKNKFNLNFFLNEQCKDAMNIMDFVNSLQLKLTDLERVGELGYVKGISHIVVNKLKDLDVCKRPIHCSDIKRETMYVKDENAWEKENGTNEKITKMIKHVAHKNQRQINEWRQENPEHKDPESVKCDKFLAIVNQSMGGATNDDDINNYNKIIKNIAKEVIIDKEQE